MQFTAQFIITLLQSHPFVFWEKLPFYYLIRFFADKCYAFAV